MKTVSFSRLNSMNIAVSDISVIYQKPLWNTLGGLGASYSGRKLNGFLLVESGECFYEWEGGSAKLERGDLIYLPRGAKRKVSVTEKEFSFYRIDINLIDALDGESIIFSEEPFVALKGAGQKLFELCEKMKMTTLSYTNRLRSISLIFEFFSSIERANVGQRRSRIEPALEYIRKHYTESLDIDFLAELCYMSKPYFFKLFKKETGTTPIAMRNELRVERAKVLLFDEECQIGEIASMLGFESIYYFSRSFKRLSGISPNDYRKGK